MKQLYFLLFIVFSTSVFSDDNFYYVNSSNGLRVRDLPSINSKTLFLLPHKTNIKVIKKGKIDIINNKKNNWYFISFYNDTGWVFGEYIHSPIPENYNHKYVYKSEDNNNAKIFFILYHDKSFSLYFYSIDHSKSMTLGGKWFEENKYILFYFNEKQSCDPDCNPKALFNDRHLNTSVTNNGYYKILKNVKEITIWNILCLNTNQYPLFQYE
jgi:hypothetical protein